MGDILSQDEIDALLSATEGDATPEKPESPEDAGERRREELRGIYVRKADLKSVFSRKYSDGEIEELVAEEILEKQTESRQRQIESRRGELRESYVEFGTGNYRRQYTDDEIETITEGDFPSA